MKIFKTQRRTLRWQEMNKTQGEPLVTNIFQTQRVTLGNEKSSKNNGRPSGDKNLWKQGGQWVTNLRKLRNWNWALKGLFLFGILRFITKMFFDFSGFCKPRVSLCFWKISLSPKGSPFGFVCFCDPRIPLAFPFYRHSSDLIRVLQYFVTQRVPSCVWKTFCHQGSPFGFHRFLSSKGPHLVL